MPIYHHSHSARLASCNLAEGRPHNWIQSINLCPSLAATQWNSSKVKRYMSQGDNCMEVFESLCAWIQSNTCSINSTCRSTRLASGGWWIFVLRENVKYCFYVFPYSKIKTRTFRFSRALRSRLPSYVASPPQSSFLSNLEPPAQPFQQLATTLRAT